jgi:hypothetical protein
MNSDGDLTYEEVRKIVVGMPDKLERNLTNRLYHRLQRRKGRLPSHTDGPRSHCWKAKEMDQ